MALNWSIADVREFHALHNTGPDAEPTGTDADREGNLQWAITERLVFATMSVGMHTITARNWQVFYRRVRMLERIHGASVYRTVDGEHQDVFITPEMVHRRIGLSTNASPLTDAQFRKNLIARMERDADAVANRYARDLENLEVPS